MGHQTPHMSMVYARISDAEVLRDYRSVLGPGEMIAGRAQKRSAQESCHALRSTGLSRTSSRLSSNLAIVYACRRRDLANATCISAAPSSSRPKLTLVGCKSGENSS
ncbi:hypothetical protein AKL17_1p0068 (plasmid) [Frigidibacter mobilis]|uniref:Uncharacterized protein n=1 Tax=Frigidibacter mobilis TaxID=1335048 RepID=A0A165SX63_9RHOB|nr:hypothetical protein AKL17_1p0068 [Frigidibacter mobilis]